MLSVSEYVMGLRHVNFIYFIKQKLLAVREEGTKDILPLCH